MAVDAVVDGFSSQLIFITEGDGDKGGSEKGRELVHEGKEGDGF